MRKLMLLLSILILLCTGVTAETPAQGFMNLLADGQYTEVIAASTVQVQQALTPEALEATLAQFGPMTGCEFASEEENSGYTISYFHVSHAALELFYVITVDADGKLAGLNILPYTPPAEADAAIRTETVLFRKGMEDETEAALTLPEGDGPFPAVILIQGSGPSDRDEAAYGIRPFLDLAEGLSRKGIASIRYDKYTYAHSRLAAANPRFSVEEEYIQDAAAALETLESRSDISGIYLIGHSQGGMLMPRMISELGSKRFAGGISLSGSPLHLWEIQDLQNLAAIAAMPAEQQTAVMSIVSAEESKAKALADCTEDAVPDITVFGLPAYYQWNEIQADAAALLNRSGIRALAIQGGADWQVTPENGAELWKERCPAMDTIVIPGLTHLLTRVEDPTGTIADYVSGAHVDQQVIDCIAVWILQ